MKTHLTKPAPLAATIAVAMAMLALGFLAALGARSLVVETASASPDAPNPGHAWTELEDHGIDGSDYWLGTTVDQALELRVNGSQGLRLEPDPTSPNVIGGYSGNSTTEGAVGAFLGGGGAAGHPNAVTDNYGTVAGGQDNVAGDGDESAGDANYATVSGGQYNTASTFFTTVGGGYDNTASGDYATICGGGSNTASGVLSTVGGGDSNGAVAERATIGGGFANGASNGYATVGGGETNAAGGLWSTVAGGKNNSASDDYATVGGGTANTASGSESTVGGGNSNTASGGMASVGGGGLNSALGTGATVCGGYDNTAAGNNAMVPGGQYSAALGDLSFAAGRYANANNQGCFVWGDSTPAQVECNDDNRFIARASGGVYLYTSSDLSTGAYLAAGSSTWQPIGAPLASSAPEPPEDDNAALRQQVSGLEARLSALEGTGEGHSSAGLLSSDLTVTGLLLVGLAMGGAVLVRRWLAERPGAARDRGS